MPRGKKIAWIVFCAVVAVSAVSLAAFLLFRQPNEPELPVEPILPETVDTPVLSEPDPIPDLDYDVRIIECLTSNTLSEHRYDWIELICTGDAPVSLDGLYLSDDLAEPKKWPFPAEILTPDTYLVLYASDLNTGYHTNFKLSAKGETLLLANEAGRILQTVEIPPLESDFSYAQSGDTWSATPYATPGYPNTEHGYALACNKRNPSPLVISEVMTTNDTYLPTNGKYYDWVELQNVSDSPIRLSEYTLSDNDNNLAKYRLPDVELAAGAYYTVLASGEPALGKKHCNFKLNGTLESLYLADSAGVLADAVLLTGIPQGCSYGRTDGQNGFFYLAQPTPDAPNSMGSRLPVAAPAVSLAAGLYEGESLTVELSATGEIYYTLDGSEPNETSISYTEPLTLTETCVLRAVSIGAYGMKSAVTTAPYFLNIAHDLPVLSIASAPDGLFSEENGIYAKGPNAAAEYPYLGANFYNNWERPANITFFENGEQAFSIDCGIRMAGSGSRANAKKSFQFRFRSKYGADTLEYALFPDSERTSFPSVTLRAGEDYPYSIFRDELFTSLAGDRMNLLALDYRYCVVYINGAYWGIYAFREKNDENTVAYYENVTPDDVTLMHNVDITEHGNIDTYYGLLQYVKKNDLTQDVHYRYVADQVDLESLADWLIIQIYTGNRDTANLRFYKAGDGKWKWIIYDLDWAFYEHQNSYFVLTSEQEASRTRMARKLLQHPEFRDFFLRRLAYHLTENLTDEQVLQRLDKLSALLESEIKRERKRWNAMTYRDWYNSVEKYYTYLACDRAQEVIRDSIAYFALTEDEITEYFGDFR